MVINAEGKGNERNVIVTSKYGAHSRLNLSVILRHTLEFDHFINLIFDLVKQCIVVIYHTVLNSIREVIETINSK